MSRSCGVDEGSAEGGGGAAPPPPHGQDAQGPAPLPGPLSGQARPTVPSCLTAQVPGILGDRRGAQSPTWGNRRPLSPSRRFRGHESEVRLSRVCLSTPHKSWFIVGVR